MQTLLTVAGGGQLILQGGELTNLLCLVQAGGLLQFRGVSDKYLADTSITNYGRIEWRDGGNILDPGYTPNLGSANMANFGQFVAFNDAQLTPDLRRFPGGTLPTLAALAVARPR